MKKTIIKLTESDLNNIIENSVKRILKEEEEFKNNQGYTHFAVNKETNKIVNGWDYSDIDSDELRTFKRDYFTVDLVDYGFNPKDYKIWTYRHCVNKGINPDDNNNWSNV